MKNQLTLNQALKPTQEQFYEEIQFSEIEQFVIYYLRRQVLSYGKLADGRLKIEMKNVDAYWKGATWETHLNSQLFDKDYELEIEYDNNTVYLTIEKYVE